MLTLRFVAIGLAAAAFLPAQNKTLLFVSRYDTDTLATNASLLGKARPFDIFAVTPGSGATAHPWVPAAGISATIGDPDNDGVLAEFTGLPHASFGITGLFVKDKDRKSGDPRKVYWTVRVPITTSPQIDVFSGTMVHTIRAGDFVRLTENGEVEFFMKQEHIMTAAGAQTGSYVPGASALCQAPNGDLFYTPAHGLSNSNTIAGGHWVNNPAKTFCYDGAIVRIPNADITYDANGNVSAVKADSARLVVNEVGTGPIGQASVRQMCVNSGARDSIGSITTITFMMTGLDIDPNGGTYDGWLDKGLPNLIFTFENAATTCCGGPWGSWVGTVFSTAKGSSGDGSIATINGTSMGATTGNGTGAWTGLKLASGSSNAPLLRGLAWIDVGWKSTAPYGNATLTAANDGTIDFTNDPNVRLALQGPIGGFPTILAVSFGIAKGARPKSIDFSGIWSGYGSLHLSTLITAFSIASNTAGQFALVDKLPNDPRLKGLNFLWQGVSVTAGQAMLTNPVVTEVK